MTHNSQERPPLREARMHLAPFGTMQVLCQCGPPKPHEDNTAEHFDSPTRQDGARRLRQLLRLLSFSHAVRRACEKCGARPLRAIRLGAVGWRGARSCRAPFERVAAPQ